MRWALLLVGLPSVATPATDVCNFDVPPCIVTTHVVHVELDQQRVSFGAPATVIPYKTAIYAIPPAQRIDLNKMLANGFE